MTQEARVGVLLGSWVHPSALPGLARKCEDLGYGEIWLSEDYFYTAALSTAATALAATERIPVGFGVVSGLVRHPAVLAMEVSTLALMYPGRLNPGIGLGFPMWLDQMKIKPPSQLGALRESIQVTRRLLAGEEVTLETPSFALEAIKLHYPAPGVPIYAGVLGPKMLKLSGEVADGTIGSVIAGADYIRWANEQIAGGRQEPGDQPGGFRSFALFACDADGDKARESARDVFSFYLWAGASTALLEAYPHRDVIRELAAQGQDAVRANLADEWMYDLAVIGTPEECAAAIQSQLDAGAASVSLFPSAPESAAEQLELAAREVLPLLH